MSYGARPHSSFQTRPFCDPPASHQLTGYWNSSSRSQESGCRSTQPGQREKECRVFQSISPRRLDDQLFSSFISPFPVLQPHFTWLHSTKGFFQSGLIWPNKLFYCRNSGHCEFFFQSVFNGFSYISTFKSCQLASTLGRNS